MHEVSYPTGAMNIKTPAYAATQAVTVESKKEYINLGELTGATTVNLTVPADQPAGAELFIKAKSDATARTVTLGTGFVGTAQAGVISKTKLMYFVYNGTAYEHVSTNQID